MAILYGWAAAIGLACLLFQCASQTVDCDFENGPCNWANDEEVVSNPPLLWGVVSAAAVIGNDVGHGDVLFVPVTPTTPDFSVSYLKHTGPNIPGGQLYCLTFDFLATDAQIGFLTIWHYWLNEKNQFYNKKVWSNEEETDGGAWKVGQVLIDGAGDWTLIAEVITNPFSIVIPTHSTGGSGIALDNIKQRPVGSADECPTLIGPHVVVETTQAATTIPSPTAPTTVGLVSVQLGEFIYTPNPVGCDWTLWTIHNTCDLRFTIDYRWIVDGTERSHVQNIHEHINNADQVMFYEVPPTVLSGPIAIGSQVRVRFAVQDHDDGGWIEGGHDDMADIIIEFTVPVAGTAAQEIEGRDDKPEWYSTMTATFTAHL
ncbi:hypothetical protein BV898_02422 [Hypsibius exemplaris]|uniref:MAM domain-containing protein n=1 Tax=Hypsibius exemplaris TaxID=2072580 RepID=A0A1W0X8F1_HYPEX|nr:hypothetical protein BV898_02422 [Hypsibius exemplaris]